MPKFIVQIIDSDQQVSMTDIGQPYANKIIDGDEELGERVDLDIMRESIEKLKESWYGTKQAEVIL